MKKTAWGILILCLATLTGCWDMREINDLGFVTAVGIDKAKPPNKYRVTVQIANANSASAQSQEGQTESGVWVGSGEGKSIFDAVRNLVRISSRRIMWAHNNVVIIGEPLAKEGIIPVVDFFTHNPELRMRTPVAITQGEAKSCILAKAGMETPSGLSFTYFNDYGSLLAETVQSTMLTVSADLAQKNGEPVIAAVTLKKMESSAESGGGQGGGKGKGGQEKTIDLSGAAVFRRDRMIGWLKPDETRGVAWVLNQTQSAVVTVADPAHRNQSVAVETDHVKAKITSHVVKGIPFVTINISGGAGIVEEDGSTKENIHQLKKEVAGLVDKQIENDIRLSLKKIQRVYKVDVLGLSTYIHYQNNREWEAEVKDKWVSLFPRVPIKVHARINVHSNVLRQEPLNISQ